MQLTRRDYQRYDYLIGMEQRNLSGMLRILGSDPAGKVHRLLDFTDRPRDIADPWYSPTKLQAGDRVLVLVGAGATHQLMEALRLDEEPEDDAKEEKKGKLPWPSKGKW